MSGGVSLVTNGGGVSAGIWWVEARDTAKSYNAQQGSSPPPTNHFLASELLVPSLRHGDWEELKGADSGTKKSYESWGLPGHHCVSHQARFLPLPSGDSTVYFAGWLQAFAITEGKHLPQDTRELPWSLQLVFLFMYFSNPSPNRNKTKLLGKLCCC